MDIGESLVAAYLRHVRGCAVVLTNVHLPGEQGELDVVGIQSGPDPRVWLCEVTTHTGGMNSPPKRPAAQRVTEKVERASRFAGATFPQAAPRFEVWSPRVRPGLVAELEVVVDELGAKGLDVGLVLNEDYTARVQELVDVARRTTRPTGDDAFRMLQILTRLRGTLTV